MLAAQIRQLEENIREANAAMKVLEEEYLIKQRTLELLDDVDGNKKKLQELCDKTARFVAMFQHTSCARALKCGTVQGCRRAPLGRTTCCLLLPRPGLSARPSLERRSAALGSRR